MLVFVNLLGNVMYSMDYVMCSMGYVPNTFKDESVIFLLVENSFGCFGYDFIKTCMVFDTICPSFVFCLARTSETRHGSYIRLAVAPVLRDCQTTQNLLICRGQSFSQWENVEKQI